MTWFFGSGEEEVEEEGKEGKEEEEESYEREMTVKVGGKEVGFPCLQNLLLNFHAWDGFFSRMVLGERSTHLSLLYQSVRDRPGGGGGEPSDLL